MPRNKEEAIAAGVPVADTQHCMQRRAPWHDYNKKGLYMLTLVVEGRSPLLGKVVTSVIAPGMADGQATQETAGLEARVELSLLGKTILTEEVRKISAVYEQVEVWKLCIMPDHIHLIISVKEDLPEGKHLGTIVRGFKGGCSRAWWRIGPGVKTPGTGAASPAAAPVPLASALSSPDAAPVPSASALASPAAAPVPSASALASPDAAPVPAVFTAGSSVEKSKGPSLFEPGYNDKLLLHEGQLEAWKHYLDDNPRRLALKRLHPDLFITTHYIDIGEWHCQTVGNRFLLDIPQKVAVIVHSAYTDADFARYREQWLACGEAGGVLVSAAIAIREKEVMHEAMERGYRVVWVRENGFPPLYKPTGRSFDACTEGRLLQVSPWEYHTEQRTISREQCLQLNRLVETIVGQ